MLLVTIGKVMLSTCGSNLFSTWLKSLLNSMHIPYHPSTVVNPDGRVALFTNRQWGDSAPKPLKNDELAASLWPLFGFTAKLCFHPTGTYSLYWPENGRNPAKICFTGGKVMLEVALFHPLPGVIERTILGQV